MKSSSPKLKRQPHSEQSLKALELIEGAEEEYEQLSAQFENLESLAQEEGANLPTLKDELAKLYGNLDRFQQQKVDTISTAELKSGKDQVRNRRKMLTNKLEVMEIRAKALRVVLNPS